MLDTYFISCDWGTTNFRLRVIDTNTLIVIEEVKTNFGIKTLYDKYKTDNDTLTQTAFFSKYLKNEIQKFSKEFQNLTIVVTGMASSNIGLQNMPYADFPFCFSGSNLNWQYLETENDLKIILISGIKDSSGMMRGEETQAIGLEQYLNNTKQGILLLPGTHSKHITFINNDFVSLKNFMTGELFEVLTTSSILANSVTSTLWDSSKIKAFEAGVLTGCKNELSANLFNVRVRDVLENANKYDNYYFLSGMLIGDELSYLKNKSSKIFLAASNPIFNMYKTALEIITNKNQLVLLDDLALKNALLIGQKKILTLHENKN